MDWKSNALLASQDFRSALKKAEQFVTISRKQDSTVLLLDAVVRPNEATRGSMNAGDERTRRMTAVVQALRREVGARPFEEDLPLDRFFSSGRPGDRIAGIASAQASPRMLYVPMALESIQRALSAFEQYHGMVLADRRAHAHSARWLRKPKCIACHVKTNQLGVRFADCRMKPPPCDEDPTLQMSWSVCHLLAPGCPAGA
jgi:hypothetical protein